MIEDSLLSLVQFVIAFVAWHLILIKMGFKGWVKWGLNIGSCFPYVSLALFVYLAFVNWPRDQEIFKENIDAEED